MIEMVETTRARTATYAQMRTLYLLAGTFGHAWADYSAEWPEDAQGEIDLDALEEQVAEDHQGDPVPGIYAPDPPDERGVIHHTTETGRTRWAVDRDGAATITISRPDGDVLRAHVPPGDRLPIEVSVLRPGHIWPRHVSALCYAVSALAHPEEVYMLAMELAPHVRGREWVTSDGRITETDAPQAGSRPAVRVECA